MRAQNKIRITWEFRYRTMSGSRLKVSIVYWVGGQILFKWKMTGVSFVFSINFKFIFKFSWNHRFLLNLTKHFIWDFKHVVVGRKQCKGLTSPSATIYSCCFHVTNDGSLMREKLLCHQFEPPESIKKTFCEKWCFHR